MGLGGGSGLTEPKAAGAKAAAKLANPAASNAPSAAPAGSLRRELDIGRDGQSQYGTIAQRFMENPAEMSALLMMPMAGATSLPRAALGNRARATGPDALRSLGIDLATNPASAPRALFGNWFAGELGKGQAQQMNQQGGSDIMGRLGPIMQLLAMLGGRNGTPTQ